MWRVYGLVDPRDERIRYVGCTSAKYLSKRLGQHLREARNTRPGGTSRKKVAWLQEVFDEGQRPTIILLQSCFTEEEGYEVERTWIARLRNDLVNESSGGKGLNDPSTELSRRISEAVKEHWRNDDGTRRARLAEIGKANIHKAITASAKKHKGTKMSPERRAGLSRGQRNSEKAARAHADSRGRKQSPEHVENRMRAQSRPEVREKMRIAKLGKKQPREMVEKRRQSLLEYNERKRQGLT